MARSSSNSVLKYVGGGVAAIVGGVAIGLVIGDMRASHSSEQVVQQPAPVVSAPAPSSAAPPALRPRANGNYTAPGAPRIVIHEESAPILRRVDRAAPTPPADTEASQEAPPVQVKPAKDSSDTAPTDSAGGSATTPAATPGDTAPPAEDNKPPAPPAAPSDPDFEHVGKPGDAESGQEGGGKAQFRVQTGSYTDESNARSIADQLRGQGYTASTRSEREGDHLVYKVQAGAYRSKNGANKAAGDLQKKGFPAYVAPITP